MNTFTKTLISSALLLALSACDAGRQDSATTTDTTTASTATPAVPTPASPTPPAQVDSTRLLNMATGADAGQWLSVGRDYDEQRFSPLTQIDKTNVAQLGLAWHADIETQRGQEATPLYIDGVLYVSTAWSHVYAYDARTGAELWHYDPQVPGETGGYGCCDVVNRGVAAWNGKIYVGAYDGRLIALDAATGKEVWSIDTVGEADAKWPYTITGAPRVVKGRVIIGNGGAEFGVRGFVSAFDAETGALEWRWYTVPGNPALGFENPQMEMAAKTWNGEWWTLGGGGSVWDSIIYDPTLNLFYLGVGNGSPWNAEFRSPGGGDNLFLSSIVALNADTGAYVWHYQQTPGESWDYTATQPMMLAKLTLNGAERRVLMQAPKNGFFYVLDAATGELISGTPYTPQTWTTGEIDATGRPVMTEGALFGRTGKPFVVAPSAQGAHSWHPWSYSPQTGLVYLPTVETAAVMGPAPTYNPVVGRANTGTGGTPPLDIWQTQPGAANLPREGARLIAWDPIAKREVWRTPIKGSVGSGTLATAGGLVFSGSPNLDGWLAAHDAASGAELWRSATQAGVVAAPMSYELDGKQYIAQLVGYGVPGYGNPNGSRLLVYTLGGTDSLPPAPAVSQRVLNPPEQTASADVIARGQQLFADTCAMCHDTSFGNRGLFPDLRYSPMLNTQAAFDSIVLGGALQAKGMRSFADVLDADATTAIRAHLVGRALALKATQ
jgi:quinohemoprotein ethanol dehydrogenase